MLSAEQQQIAAREVVIVGLLWIFWWLGGMFLFAGKVSPGLMGLWSPLVFLYFLRWLIWALRRIQPGKLKEGLVLTGCAIGLYLLVSALFTFAMLTLRLLGMQVMGIPLSTWSLVIRLVVGLVLFWWFWRLLPAREDSPPEAPDNVP